MTVPCLGDIDAPCTGIASVLRVQSKSRIGYNVVVRAS